MNDRITSPSKTKRKLDEYQQQLNETEKDHFRTFDIVHDQIPFSKYRRLSSQSSLSTRHHQQQPKPVESNITSEQEHELLPSSLLEIASPSHFETKIVQEFNIQQINSSDITVSSTINIKSYSNEKITKQPQESTITANDLLSEADFDRVLKDITPADRNLFDEFLIVGSTATPTVYSSKKSDEEDLFQLVENNSTNNNQTSNDSSSRHHLSSCDGVRYTHDNLSDRRRSLTTTMQQQNATIHYLPQNMCHIYSSSSSSCNDSRTNRPHLAQSSLSGPAANTLKEMAIQHQQRLHPGVHSQYYHPTQRETYQPQQRCIATDDNAFNSSTCNSQLRQATIFKHPPQPLSYSKKHVHMTIDGTMQSNTNPYIPQYRSSHSFASTSYVNSNTFYQQQHQQNVRLPPLYSSYAPQMSYYNITEMPMRQQVSPSSTSTHTTQAYQPYIQQKQSETRNGFTNEMAKEDGKIKTDHIHSALPSSYTTTELDSFQNSDTLESNSKYLLRTDRACLEVYLPPFELIKS
ncbi:unnamed protein product [Didymodactylos carnosus]|uniref:Uncharacterized protein n=1 Tax=Didymodactylos carnosus TaxID=1234261 RepID=A0A8S2HYK7_9BILA|nr:unnamed protein product [Didymodactylos carnosus]CAF3674250.1 unnamed protein product [Didymodactylos carnosus]